MFFSTDNSTNSFCDPDDGNVIKHLLTRLTHRSTFPNILFRGKSIGGSDDLNQLHANKTLAELIEQAGAIPRSDGFAK
jgi:glutaredoxin-related protein